MRVNAWCSFIQYQNGRIGHHGSCECQQLSLTVRKSCTSFTDFRIVSFFQFHDEFMCMDCLRRSDNLFIRCIWLSITDIILYCPREQIIIPCHDSHLFSQALQCHFLNVMSVNPDTSLCRIVESADQMYNGRFSCSGRTDQCNGFPRFYLKIYIMQNHPLRLIRISKRYMVKRDSPCHFRQFIRIILFFDIGLHIQHFEYTFCCR